MDIACISRHLLLPYNYHYSRKLIYVPASAGIYCFLITKKVDSHSAAAPASAGIYCFLITIINKWSHIPFIDTYHGTLKQFYYL